GIDSISEVPADRWNTADFYDEHGKRGKMSTRWGGFLSNIDRFDPKFFGISPREASRMDPQQRLLLEVSWEALENAGINPDTLAGSRTGVFVGISSYDYSHLQFSSAELVDAYAGTGNAHSVAANRLSYVLDLQGPSMAIDTACSSSLVAAHQAIRSLRSGESDMALVGGVNLLLSPELTIAFSQARMMASDGHCKTFDAKADGYVRGEGCGVVVLKRLSDAQRDGDTVLAVLRGSAVNQDGRSNGLTAPNGRAQQAVIRQAMDDAGVEPSEIDYIEAHGTGTPLGDPIEIQALRAVLDGQKNGRPIYVGSVKTNIGHLESAAGIAGLIKVILSLRHGCIPPHLNYTELNPYIDLTNSTLKIAGEGAPWSEGEEVRIAGVSSFGFGGTNAHLVVSEYVDTAEPAPTPNIPDASSDMEEHMERPLHLLALSAKSENALRQLAGKYAGHFQQQTDLSLADVAYSANTSRKQFDYRLAVSGADSETVREKLMAAVSSKTAVAESARSTEKIAFLFTGQGAQFAGMGWELFETQPVFREALVRCAEILDAYMERPLLEIMFAEPDSKAANWLNHTEFTQPALFALEYSLAQLWLSWGIRPDVVMGHSVGEYVAACLAGVFSLEDGLKLISARSQLMGTLPQEGAMVAVFAPESVVLETLSTVSGAMIGVAAVNGPQSVVISGERVAVKKAMGQLGEQGVETRPLVVSHAFHSPLMDPILDLFEEVADGITFHAPQIPLISNLDGSVMETAPNAKYWREHIRRPVYFSKGMQALFDQGTRIFLEVGPQPHLLGMGRRCLTKKEAETPMTWLPSLRPPKGDWQVMLDSLGRLYQAGFEVDWRGFDAPYTRSKVSLPTYAFDRDRYWLETDKQAATVPSTGGERLHSGPGLEVVRLATAVPLYEALLEERPQEEWTAAYNRVLGVIANHLWGSGSHQTNVMVIDAERPNGQIRVQLSLTLLGEGAAAVQLFRQQENGWQVIGSGQLVRGQVDAPVVEQDALKEQPEAEESEAADVLAFLTKQASVALGLPLAKLPQDRPLDSLGMDSLMAIEMRSAIERELQVTLPVVEFLQGPTLIELAERVEGLLGDGAGLDVIPVYEGDGPHPLTHSQQAMWFLHELLPDELSLNVSGAVRLTGKLDTAALRQAVVGLVKRHPALRTTYTLLDGLPVQEVGLSDLPNRSTVSQTNEVFFVVDAADWPEAKIAAYLEQEAHRAFDLEHGPLLRLVVLRRTDEEHLLLLSVSHIAADFWSMSVIVQELYGRYAAEMGDIESVPLPELPISYTDYARWGRERLDGAEGQRLRDYWLEKLHGELPLLDLPTDRPRPASQQFDGQMAHLTLPEELSDQLHALSHEYGTTLYTTLLAAFQTLLHRYTGQNDLLVGSVLAGRDRPELAGLVGYFINPVAMRANFEGDPTFGDLLAQARETVLGAFDHQEYPLPLLAEQLHVRRDPGRPPIFETMFIMQRAQSATYSAMGDNLNALALGLPGAQIQLGGLTAESLSLGSLPAQFDLTLMMTEVEQGLAAALHYNTALFDTETAERMLAHLQMVLAGVVEAPERPLSQIQLMPDSERQRLLVDWNKTQAAYPSDKPFFQLFEEQVVRTPLAPAVADAVQTYNYETLNERANRLAHYLKGLGVG
ncbi:MAG: condensation domain-containing protein, partial [Candidatus Promineifilaceae bacterium]